MPIESLALNWRKFDERYKLIGSKCLKCNKEFFPKRTVCPNCRSKGKIVDQEMPRKGIIYSYTKVFSAPKGYEDQTPYYLAIIELENKVKVLSQLADAEDNEVRIGAPVEKCFRKIIEPNETGIISYGYKFKIIK